MFSIATTPQSAASTAVIDCCCYAASPAPAAVSCTILLVCSKDVIWKRKKNYRLLQELNEHRWRFHLCIHSHDRLAARATKYMKCSEKGENCVELFATSTILYVVRCKYVCIYGNYHTCHKSGKKGQSCTFSLNSAASKNMFQNLTIGLESPQRKLKFFELLKWHLLIQFPSIKRPGQLTWRIIPMLWLHSIWVQHFLDATIGSGHISTNHSEFVFLHWHF